MNWWLASCIASGAGAILLGFALGACWFGDQTDDTDYERQTTEGDPCPWPLGEE